MRTFFLLATSFLALIGASAQAREAGPCPASLGVTQKPEAVPETWDGMDAWTGPHRLRAISFFSGHPKELGEIKPSIIDSSQAGLLLHGYEFSGRYADGVWLACRYELTSLILFRRLPKVPKSCEIVYVTEPRREPGMSCR